MAGKRLVELFYAANLISDTMENRSWRAGVYTEQGEVLSPEAWPINRVLQGETITPNNAVIILLRDSLEQELFFSNTGGPLLDTQGRCCGAVFLMKNITKQKHDEHQLQEQAQRLQVQADLINLSHEAVFVCDHQRRIISWNLGAERLYGWSAEEAIGQLPHLMLKTKFPYPFETMMDHLRHEIHWEGELTHFRRDGSPVMVESRWAVVHDEDGSLAALLSINHDITERVRLERIQQQLHAETEVRRKLLQTVLDALPCSVSLLRGPEARLVLANQATSSFWGASRLENQSFEDFFRKHGLQAVPDEGRDVLSIVQEVMYGEAVLQSQGTIRTQDGKEISTLVNIVPFELDQLYPVDGYFGYLEEQECAMSNRAVLVVAQDISTLKEAERLKDEFLSLAAHELRTPLTVLSSYVQLLQKHLRRTGMLSQEAAEMFSLIESSRSQLVELTRLMLDVTHVQAGRLQLFPRPVELLKVLHEMCVRLQITTTNHQLVIGSSLEKVLISADLARLEQVLTNLIGNAIKYSPEGGQIAIRVWEEALKGEVQVSIHDEGMGIPLEQQPHLFERFVRGRNTQEIAGTGLGLYLSRTLVEMQRGRIWFESKEGEGSTFFLAFPVLAYNA
jgi:PAS domain S-box-containing protein